MKRTAKILPFFFIGLWALLNWGFYKTYLIHFPTFKNFITLQHLHGMAMIAWVIMLIVQPLLIGSGKNSWHKKLGYISYVLAPLVVATMLLIIQFAYDKSIERQSPPTVAIGDLALTIPSMISFGLLYILAIVYKKNTFYHMRYMIATGILLMDPGLSRILGIYFHYPFEQAIAIVLWTTSIIAGILLCLDALMRKSIWPYAIVFFIFLAGQICWEARMSHWWQAFGKSWVGLFY